MTTLALPRIYIRRKRRRRPTPDVIIAALFTVGCVLTAIANLIEFTRSENPWTLPGAVAGLLLARPFLLSYLRRSYVILIGPSWLLAIPLALVAVTGDLIS